MTGLIALGAELQYLQVLEQALASAWLLQRQWTLLQGSLRRRARFSKALLLGCALAEATAIYGFVIGLLIIMLLK